MSIKGINFIDIETIPAQVPENTYNNLFAKKFAKEIAESSILVPGIGHDMIGAYDKVYNEKAALYAEFGQIICICIGRLSNDNKFYVKKISGTPERDLLTKFYASIAKSPGILCAHNGSEFDFPFLMRKYMMNSLPIPPELNVMGKKPWDVPQEDTMKMWGGTAWNYKISLDLLCHSLGVPSPKDALSGKRVGEFYSEAVNKEEALAQIADYCAGDVIAMMNCYCRMKGIDAPSKGSIIIYE